MGIVEEEEAANVIPSGAIAAYDSLVDRHVQKVGCKQFHPSGNIWLRKECKVQ